MKPQQITSFKDFHHKLNKNSNLFMMIYKKGAEQSECALNELESLEANTPTPLFSVNVAEVKDVHTAYNITTAPVIIEFKNGKPARQLKGCHRQDAFRRFLSPIPVTTQLSGELKQKQVVVYTTPTCSWCRTLKDYLRNNNISFREIDVTKDEKAAADMVKRSGQKGVPQSIIDGHIIVGFDRKKINTLLNI
jgi:glutaredoxin-like YruB-family protein